MSQPAVQTQNATPKAPSSPEEFRALFARRDPFRKQFLEKCGWTDADEALIGEDCAFRRYFRLTRGIETCILMDSITEFEAIVAPAHRLRDFVPIAQALTGIGMSAPTVYEYDLDHGYALLEDFGNVSFNAAKKRGDDLAGLYRMATMALIHLRDHADEMKLDIKLPNYYDGHVHHNRRDIVTWYRPALTGERTPDGMMDDYLAAWDAIEKSLAPPKMMIQHCDYHMDNLMLLEGRAGVQKCGWLDFQGAVMGPWVYDLANLLEDARNTVPDDIKHEMTELYCANMDADERAHFDAWYTIMATQFHCRVIGLFVRLLVRDGKDMHFHHIPRLQNYIATALQKPVMKPLKDWFDRSGIDITKPLPDFDPAAVRKLVL